jgi:hypothetical protein
LTRRIIFGSIIAAVSIIGLVVIPYKIVTTLQGYGLILGLSLWVIVAFGVVLTALTAAAYIAQPTKAYGPLFIAKSGVALAYLFVLAGAASFSLSVKGGTSVSMEWSALIWLVMIIPAIKIIAGLVITLEDVRHPGERLPYDFPPDKHDAQGT